MRHRDALQNQPWFYDQNRKVVAKVNSLGHLEFVSPCVDSKDAVMFAKWIVDTFGEATP
jgi:hypothetical protein